MRIIVCVKQTVDTEAVIEVGADGRIVATEQTLVIDPYSEFAVEKAVQLKEMHGGEVVILTLGGPEAVSAVRHALSMGADVGYMVEDAAIGESDASGKAQMLAAALRKLSPDLVFGGCKSADTSGAQILLRVATLLDLPHVNVVTALDLEGGVVHATREIDDGIEFIDVNMPAVITAQQGLAEPRYPNVRAIMQSKKKPITTWSLADIDLDADCVGHKAVKLISRAYRDKPVRAGGRIVEGELHDVITETVGLLGSEAKVI